MYHRRDQHRTLELPPQRDNKRFGGGKGLGAAAEWGRRGGTRRENYSHHEHTCVHHPSFIDQGADVETAVAAVAVVLIGNKSSRQPLNPVPTSQQQI